MLLEVLDQHPEVVLTYPLNRRIETDGALHDKRSWEFDTAGVDDWRIRFRQTMHHMSAGNMVYGLGRVGAIRRAGVYRRVLVPDRLLLMELALEGQFRQAPALLWFRRVYGQTFSLERQHRAFFPNGRPLYAFVPWWIESCGRAHLVARHSWTTGAGDRPLGRISTRRKLPVEGRTALFPAGVDQHPSRKQAASQIPPRPDPLAVLQDQTQGVPEMAGAASAQVAAPVAVSLPDGSLAVLQDQARGVPEMAGAVTGCRSQRVRAAAPAVRPRHRRYGI